MRRSITPIARRRRIEAETAPPLPRTAASGHAPSRRRSALPSGSRGATLTAMARPAPAASRCTSEEFFELVARGMLAHDDRVELLEGVIVAMAPQNPRHATGVHMVHDAVSRAVGTGALVRQQFPLIAGLLSVPEPDVAVVPGSVSDYLDRHPTTALLVVEVADSSIVQDRLTKTAIHA